jgi:prepilin-type N-terminal cleavage/methylation domain-containing protein/prepilin-type processing-associated H-X9-DG protein
MNKKAFTLIELLVVIAILGFLLVIIFPVMGRVREGARRAQCSNNLRQHGIAWYLYLDEHKDRFPAAFIVQGKYSYYPLVGGTRGGTAPYDGYGAVGRILNRYLDIDSDTSPNVELFHCPDDVKASSNSQINTTQFDYCGNSYLINERILRYGGAGSKAKERPFRTITCPTNKVYLERCNMYNNPGHGGRGRVLGGRTPAMVLFVDGHVAGPFLYYADFEAQECTTERPVIVDPNGTGGIPGEYD